MNAAALLARRLAGGGLYARLALWLATGSVALGVAVMVVAVSVTTGFEREVQRKIIGFTADLQIGGYLPTDDDSLRLFASDDKKVRALPGRFLQIESVSPYVRRQAILKSSTALEGVELKGIDRDWNKRFFGAALKAGKLPVLPDSGYGNQTLISRKIADALGLNVGDKARLYFWEEDRVRVRPVLVSGVYETGLAEFDAYVALCDIRLLQRMMGIGSRVQGFEVHLKPDYAADTILSQEINRAVHFSQRAVTAQDLFPELFQWLRLQHQNVAFILILMTTVAVINMASAILVLITERTPTIGLLKALGATDGLVAQIFWRQGLTFIGAGMACGNALAFLLLFIQEKTGLIQLDEESYFVPTAPVAWEWDKFLALNALVAVICAVALLIPVRYVRRVSPVRALKM